MGSQPCPKIHKIIFQNEKLLLHLNLKYHKDKYNIKYVSRKAGSAEIFKLNHCDVFKIFQLILS